MLAYRATICLPSCCVFAGERQTASHGDRPHHYPDHLVYEGASKVKSSLVAPPRGSLQTFPSQPIVEGPPVFNTRQFKMSLSVRLICVLAMAALAPKPVRTFLLPTTSPTTARQSCHATSAHSRTACAFRGRISPQQRSSDGPAKRRRGRAYVGPMMAKKKNRSNDSKNSKSSGISSTSKASATGSSKGKGSSGGASVVDGSEGVSTAVAEAPVDVATRKLEQSSPADPETIAGAAAPDVNKSPSPKKTIPDSGGSPKGFGAPIPPPKSMQKGSNKTPKPPPAKPVTAEGVSTLPPPRQPAGGMDALAPGVPVAGSTDHQKVITDEELSSPEPLTTVPIAVGEESEMSPEEMLQYLRDNNLSIDFETMNPVEIPRDPSAKVEAMFPYPAANIKAKYCIGSTPKPSDLVEAILPLLPEDEPWNGKKVRPLPDLKDFLVANRLHGGSRGMAVITALLLKAMSEGDLERAKDLKGVAICVTKAENAVTGPFRQAVMFAENRMAPYMGSTICEEYAGKDGGDAAATWVVLKACVAEWELRLRECRKEEVGLHDIFRALPNPTDGLDEERIASITGSVQAMGQSFRNNAKLMQSVPPEIRFMEGALGLNTTTEVRRFALQEFCPQEGMSPEDLRFRISSMICGLEQLPSKSYHQLQVAAADVYKCIVDGTPDDYNIYTDNWEDGGSLSFNTYRLDTGEKWRNKLREIVTAPIPRADDTDNYDKLLKEVLPRPFWGFLANDVKEEEPPFVMLKKGWWDCLDYLDEDKVEEKMREEAIEAAKIKGPEGVEDDEIGDIFSDFEKEERNKMAEFNFSDEDFEEGDGDDDIRDGPGPGMEELDLDSISWMDL